VDLPRFGGHYDGFVVVELLEDRDPPGVPLLADLPEQHGGRKIETLQPTGDVAPEGVELDCTRGNIRAIDHLCRTALHLAARQTIDTVDAGLVTAARKKLP